MTSIPDELLAINVRLKAMLLGLTNHDKIVVNYKAMISNFRIVASMTQYKETSKIILNSYTINLMKKNYYRTIYLKTLMKKIFFMKITVIFPILRLVMMD